MNRVTGLAAALLSALLLAATAAVAMLTWVSLDLDLTPHKGRVVNELNARIGLRLEVTGALTLRLGPELGLRAEGLTLTSPSTGAAPLLRAHTATLTAATLPLLRGRLEIGDLELSRAQLDLTRDKSGRHNWELSAPVAGAPAIVLDGLRLRIRSSRVVYKDQRTGQVLRIGVRALETRRTGDALKIALDGDIDGEPVRLTGQTAPLEHILAADAPIRLDLRGQFLGLDLSADGALALPGTGTPIRATLTLKAKTLRGLSHWLGPGLAALGPVDARFVLDGDDGRYTLAPLAVGIGPTRAHGQISLDLKGRRPKVDLDLTLDLGLDTQGASPSLDLDLRGDKLMIAPLLAGTAAEGQVRGDLDARARLRASGPTAAALAFSLGGDVLLLVEGVEAPVQGLDSLGGGARVILGQILTPRSSTARIECGLVVLTFKAGRTEIKGVIDTPNSIVAGEGRLDLVKESIELRLVPQPKGVAILSVAAPVRVSGRLAAPDYRIEPGGLVTRLADLAARIVVPQLLLIDAFGQAGADSSCGKILAGEQSLGDGPRPLEAVRGAVESAVEAPGAVVRGAGEGVQDAGELIGGSRGPVRGAGGAVIEGTGELIKGVGGLLKGAGEAVKGVPQSGPSQGSEPGPVP